MQLALVILQEDFKCEYCGGEIVLSTRVTGMPRATRAAAVQDLITLGLIKVKRNGQEATRVTRVAS